MSPTALDEKNLKKIFIALALYLASLFASNTLGLKIMPMPFGLQLSVAVFYFPVVFLMTDVIGEVYGKRIAKLFVLAGFIATVLFILYSIISLAAPWSPNGLWAHDGYNLIFAVSVRMAIASVIAFLIAEYQDVISFFFFRKFWGEHKFWLRSMLASLWSQLLDSTIFMTIAFYGVYGNHTLVVVIISWWLFKVAMGFLYTPLLYVGLWLLRDRPTA
jgi:uncharacterized integral membrane protein (TIGR00697 family)